MLSAKANRLISRLIRDRHLKNEKSREQENEKDREKERDRECIIYYAL